MRIFLTGFMGAGKTTVGKSLSAALRYPFVDLDTAIEELAAKPIPAIFEEWGERRFRELEHDGLRRVSAVPDVVVATGGGTYTFEGNRALIRRRGLAVWLHPSFSTIVSRIGATGKRDRPLFRSPEDALALYRRRIDAYRLADLTVDIGPDETPREVAARIQAMLRERACAT